MYHPLYCVSVFIAAVSSVFVCLCCDIETETWRHGNFPFTQSHFYCKSFSIKILTTQQWNSECETEVRQETTRAVSGARTSRVPSQLAWTGNIATSTIPALTEMFLPLKHFVYFLSTRLLAEGHFEYHQCGVPGKLRKMNLSTKKS